MFALLSFILLWSHPFVLWPHSSLLEWECLLCAIVFGEYIIYMYNVYIYALVSDLFD
jgi:hypothetical protein